MIYTNEWDIWLYQVTNFSGPGGYTVEERDSCPKEVLEGHWRTMYTNEWDIWPYQATNFSGRSWRLCSGREGLLAKRNCVANGFNLGPSN